MIFPGSLQRLLALVPEVQKWRLMNSEPCLLLGPEQPGLNLD